MDRAIDLIAGSAVDAAQYTGYDARVSGLLCGECKESALFVRGGGKVRPYFRHETAGKESTPCNLRARESLGASGARKTPEVIATLDRKCALRLVEVINKSVVHRMAGKRGFFGIKKRSYLAWKDDPFRWVSAEDFQIPFRDVLTGFRSKFKRIAEDEFSALLDSSLNPYLLDHITSFYNVGRPERIYGSMAAMGWARVVDIIMGLQKVQTDRDTRAQITQVGRLLSRPPQTRPACLDQKPTPAFIDLCASNTLFTDKDLHDVPLWELLEQMAQVAMTKFVYHLPLIEFMSAPWEVTGDSGFVYVAANTHQFGPSNTYKIGRTNDLVRRMDELSRPTGVLGRYRVLFFEPTEDPVALERAVHERLAHCRVEQGKEFFRAELGEIKRAIRESARQFTAKRQPSSADAA